jgi:hypothetical protein
LRPQRKRRDLKVRWNPERKIYEPVLLEEHVLREIVDRLWFQAKIRMVRINQPVGGKVRQNESGIPDLVGELPRRPFTVTCSQDVCASTIIEIPPTPLYIEVKRPGGARRAAQIRFIEEKKSAGCAAFFAESWLDVIRELYSFGVRLSA